MKKKIFVSVLCLAIISASAIFFTSSKERPAARHVKAWQVMELSKDFDSAYIATLSEAGFDNIGSVKNLKYVSARKYWMDKYGLYFLGDDEMQKFLKDNDFIIGDASRFLEEIPKTAGKEMIDNFKKAFNEPYFLFYQKDKQWVLKYAEVSNKPDRGFCDNGHNTNDYIEEGVMRRYNIPVTNNFCIEVHSGYIIQIVSGANCFNTTGLTIEDGILKAVPPKDPIAVVKVNNGWVQLAGW